MIFALLLCVVPVTAEVTDEVDIIEINHVYDIRWTDTNYILSKHTHQIIFWRWIGHKSAHHVVAWKMNPRSVPKLRNGLYEFSWNDVDDTPRIVRAKIYRETHELFDPELCDRVAFPKEKRGGLSGRKRP